MVADIAALRIHEDVPLVTSNFEDVAAQLSFADL